MRIRREHVVREARAEAEGRPAVIHRDHGRAGRRQRADRLEAVDEADVQHDRRRQQRAREAAAEGDRGGAGSPQPGRQPRRRDGGGMPDLVEGLHAHPQPGREPAEGPAIRAVAVPAANVSGSVRRRCSAPVTSSIWTFRVPVRDSASVTVTSSAWPSSREREGGPRAVAHECDRPARSGFRPCRAPRTAPCAGRRRVRACRGAGAARRAPRPPPTPSIETPDASIVPASSTAMSKRAVSPTG